MPLGAGVHIPPRTRGLVWSVAALVAGVGSATKRAPAIETPATMWTVRAKRELLWGGRQPRTLGRAAGNVNRLRERLSGGRARARCSGEGRRDGPQAEPGLGDGLSPGHAGGQPAVTGLAEAGHDEESEPEAPLGAGGGHVALEERGEVPVLGGSPLAGVRHRDHAVGPFDASRRLDWRRPLSDGV